MRGTNRYLPRDIAVQWCRPVADGFHARNSARGRRYRFVRAGVGQCGRRWSTAWWAGSFARWTAQAMHAAAAQVIGEHDFSSFRAAGCQSPTPVKTLRRIEVSRRGAYWRFDFDANAFLHHMVRNLMGCLLAVGSGRQAPGWMAEVLAARSRDAAAPTFPPTGCTSWARTTMRCMPSPSTPPRCDWIV